MSILSKLKSIFKSEKERREARKIESDIPIYRKETPEKILETKIRPIRVPTILDIGERLGIISSDLADIRQSMVTKLWLRTEYDEGKEIINKLETIDQKLDNLQNFIIKSTRDLFHTIKKKPKELTNSKEETQLLPHTEKILDIISQKGKISYGELKNLADMSDPTLSKYLKQLLEDNKIEKEKDGRFTYYSLPASLIHPERLS